MSRREGRDSDSRRHRSRFDREPSPKRSRRDSKPETERVPSNADLDVGGHTDQDQKHRRRLKDALPLEAPSARDSKPENGSVSKEPDKKPNENREGPKHSSNPTEVPRSQSYFQHDERGNASQVGRSIGRRATGERGWRDSKDHHDERSANRSYHAHRRDEKLQSKQDDNSVWRHDRFLEKDDPPPPAKKRPAFQEKKIPVKSENDNKVEAEIVKSGHTNPIGEGSERREERSRNPHYFDRPDKPSVGNRLPLKRGEAHRDGFLSRERYNGGGSYRGRDRTNGRQSGGARVEKWKHDMYNPSRSPTPKNEDDQIAKLEALLAS